MLIGGKAANHRPPCVQQTRPMPPAGLANFVSKLIISQAYGEACDGTRFRGYEPAVYAWRGAAAGARLCGPAGGPLRHHPRAMGRAGQGGTHRRPETDRARGTDGNAADYPDPADR